VRVVNSLDELLRLPRDSRVNGFGVRTRVRLEIPDFTRHALLRTQNSLNRLQSRCGCVVGGVVTFAMLVFGVIYAFQRNSSWLSLHLLGDLALVLLIAFVSGFAAKMATLAITRWQFALRCRAQHDRLVQLIQGGRHVHVHSMGR
jgi:hypothetical protein